MMKPVTLAGMMAALLVNVGAFAQPITDGALEARSTAAAEASGGMPQLDFSNPLMLAQVVWLLIIFGILYYVLANVVLPRFDSVLENRRARIQETWKPPAPPRPRPMPRWKRTASPPPGPAPRRRPRSPRRWPPRRPMPPARPPR
ncbi:hypothetical protein ACFQU7_01990 [Pseudoroseomonas wenyumeiae]